MEDTVYEYKRKRPNGTACKRCKTRKKRCNGSFILGKTCSGCDQAGKLCQFDEQDNQVLIKQLQDKVMTLEAQLKGSKSGATNYSNSPITANQKSSPNKSSSYPTANSIVECAAYLPLKNDEQTSLYVGNSGISVAHLIQAYLLDNIKPSPQQVDLDNNESIEDYDYSKLKDIFNNDYLTGYYLENYLSVTHTRYPFLEKAYIQSLHTNRHLLLESDNSNIYRPMDKFTLTMVYAIGAHLKPEKVAIKRSCTNHWILYRHALSGDLQMIFQNVTMSNIHAILLLVIYKLRFPDGQAIWYLIGTAMRSCVDLGLHRKNIEFFINNPYIYIIRTKTFWSAYALERLICYSFGRPFSISDRDIDIDLPLDIDESITDEDTIRAKFFQTFPRYRNGDQPTISPKGLNPKSTSSPLQGLSPTTGNHQYQDQDQLPSQRTTQRTSVSMALIFLKSKIIDSSIQNSIYRVDQVYSEIPRDVIIYHQQKMKQWISELPDFLSKFEYDYCLYLFNKQIQSLIMPFINKLELDDELFVECIKASVMVCKLNRRIHDSANYRHTFSFISLQTLFLSGITIVYGLLSKKVKWDFNVSEGLRNCSSSLVLLAERCPSCSKYRDSFENLVDQVNGMRQPTPSESSSEITSDLFGQGGLLEKVNKSHYRDNMNTFNNIANIQYTDDSKDFDVLFNFSNFNNIFYKLGNLNPQLSDFGESNLCIE